MSTWPRTASSRSCAVWKKRGRFRSSPKPRRASSPDMAFAKLIAFDRPLSGVSSPGFAGPMCSQAEMARREAAAYQRGVDAARALGDQQMVEFLVDIEQLSETVFKKLADVEPAIIAQLRD